MNKGGRPKRELDYELILELCSKGNSAHQIGKKLGCSHMTILRAYPQIPAYLRSKGWGEEAISKAIAILPKQNKTPPAQNPQ